MVVMAGWMVSKINICNFGTHIRTSCGLTLLCIRMLFVYL